MKNATAKTSTIDGAEIIRLIALAVAPLVRAELAASADADPWVPHTKWPWSRRVALARAKSFGAVKSGRTWLLRQSELDRAIEAMRVAPKKVELEEDDLLAMTSRAARKATSRRA